MTGASGEDCSDEGTWGGDGGCMHLDTQGEDPSLDFFGGPREGPPGQELGFFLMTQ